LTHPPTHPPHPPNPQDHAAQYVDIIAIVDPPRAGLHKAVLRALRGCNSIRRLVYVACNPSSLAGDVSRLCKPGRTGDRAFRPVRAAAFDLFPHTPHVESVMLLER